MNADLYDKKEFHNPGILEVLMATYNIDGYGSNYPKELFDPAGYSPNMFYDSLRRQAAIKEEMKVRDCAEEPVQGRGRCFGGG